MGYAANRSDQMGLPIHVAPPTAPDCEISSLALMVRQLSDIGPKSGAEALRALRVAFPDSPLTLRVAALNMLMRQRDSRSGYMPR